MLFRLLSRTIVPVAVENPDSPSLSPIVLAILTVGGVVYPTPILVNVTLSISPSRPTFANPSAVCPSGGSIVTPGAAFQFTESYQGPGLSNHTIIQRTTTIQSVTDTTSTFTQ